MNQTSCIIIGFGPGLGFALARAFGGEGFPLGLVSRDPGKHAALVRSLADENLTATTYAADAGDEASLAGALAQAQQDLGEAGVLIYNAVAPTFGKPTTLAARQLVADFRVNVVGAHVAACAVVPGMKQRGRGSILFTGGGWALSPWDEAASPGIGKAGLRSLAFTLAQELEGTGIHVATVTVAGQVRAGTDFDPEIIAQAFVRLHRQPAGAFETETIFQG